MHYFHNHTKLLLDTRLYQLCPENFWIIKTITNQSIYPWRVFLCYFIALRFLSIGRWSRATNSKVGRNVFFCHFFSCVL